MLDHGANQDNGLAQMLVLEMLARSLVRNRYRSQRDCSAGRTCAQNQEGANELYLANQQHSSTSK